MIDSSLFLARAYSHSRDPSIDIQSIKVFFYLFLFFVFIKIIHSIYTAIERRKELQRKEYDEYQRLQARLSREYDQKKREERLEYERRLVAQLENALSRLESSRRNSIKSQTLDKHIREYSDFLDSFKKNCPSFTHLINSRYTKPLDYANSKLKKMLQNEAKLSSQHQPEPTKKMGRIRYPERDKLTKSLRYEILSRDNFRCCICGRSAADGVKLHVDHIFPVSKGGKTEPANLRTLCVDCNLGKGAKIEEGCREPITDAQEEISFWNPRYSSLVSKSSNYSVQYVASQLTTANKLFRDNTAKAGAFWIASDDEIDTWICGITIDGKKAAFCKSSSALDGKPGWWIK